MSFITGDQVYDTEFMSYGEVIAINGIWAWIKLNDASPNDRPVSSRVDYLTRRKEESE